MRTLMAAAAAVLLGLSGAARAQTPVLAWAPKKEPLQPYVAPNKPLWKLSDILAGHASEKDWRQPIVRTKDLAADWHQMAPGGKTRQVEYPDNRVALIIWSGQLRVGLKGQAPFTASKGFEIDVPFRIPFTLETVGDQPALWFEIHQAGDIPIYPVSANPDKPEDAVGYTYRQVLLSGGEGTWDDRNRPYLDYYKDVVNGGARADAFIAGDHMFVNNIRGPGVARPADSDLGHFHVDFTEFWFIMEGKIDYQIEGVPFFTAQAGDVVTAEMGRWHRASFSAGQMDTRVAINPFPHGLHDFPPESGGRQ